MAFATPLVHGGELISPSAHRTVAYDLATGKENWWVGYGDGFSNVPRPVVGHGLVFLSTGFNVPNMIAVKLGGSGDVTASHLAWSLRRGAPLTPSPILVGDELYMVSDNGIATCVDAKSGSVLWQERLGGNHSASPVSAGGRIYFLSEEGESVVIAPGRRFRKLATNQLDGRFLASLAVSGGGFFARSAEALYRIEAR
jgi:outer membrane protein assembly factor BamB